MLAINRFLKALPLILLVAVVAAYFARNVIGHRAVETAAQQITGFPLEVDDLNVSPFANIVDVHGITLRNPADFEEPICADVERVYLNYDLPSMFGGAHHVYEMRLEIKEVVIATDKKGETNVARLKGIMMSGADSPTKFRVDTLRVKVDRVTHVSYLGDGITRSPHDVKLNVTYKHITDSTQINKLVLLTVLSKVKLPDIGIPADDLARGVGSVTNATGKVIKGAGDVLEGAGEGIFDAGKRLFRKIVPGGETRD
jgi:hypothetical protein